MSRSLKKGPFISVKLEKKVAAMAASGKSNVIKYDKTEERIDAWLEAIKPAL